MPDDYLLKICLIGYPSEVKTDWVRRFAEGKFTTNYLPIQGVDITTKQIQVDGNTIKLILVDTAGQKFFGKLRPSYYRGASAAIITFDKGDRDTFKAVKKWYREFKKHIPAVSVPIALVGFLAEPEVVTSEMGENLADELGLSYNEVSSYQADQLHQIIENLTRKVLLQKEKHPPDKEGLTKKLKALLSKILRRKQERVRGEEENA